MLSIAQAQERILRTVRPRPSELVAIDRALGRYLAADVVARRPLPPYDNSAMDGFAVRIADLPGELRIAGTIAAGHPVADEVAPGHAWRIMTGAPTPEGADAVVIREDVDDRGDVVAIPQSVSEGQHIRRLGEDVAVGECVVPAGTRLGPGEIGVIAALGHAAISAHQRPRVAIMSTGDELVGVDVTPGPGQIINSNAYALAAQVREAGGVPIANGIAPDRQDDTVAMLRRGLQADVFMTSGGVSVGEFDIVRSAFQEVGVELDFWKVAMKPGKPLAFGVADTGTLFFGLPGNPVSSMVVFELFARPALLAMQGATRTERPRVRVTLTRPYRKRPGRAHLVRARVRRVPPAESNAESASGHAYERLEATPLSKQGSGMISSMVDIDALVEFPAEAGDTPAGAQLSAILLRAV